MDTTVNKNKDTKILDEILHNATELPIESQNLLLMLAKGMAYTRECIKKQTLSNRTSH